MKQKRPNSVSKEYNQDNYLIHLKSPVGFAMPLLFLLFLGAGGFFAFRNPEALDYLSEVIKGDDIQPKLVVLAVISTYLLFFFGIMRMLLPNNLTFDQQPVFSYRNRILRNIIALLWLLIISAVILSNIFKDLYPFGWEGGMNHAYLAKVNVLIGIVCLIFLLIVGYFVWNFFKIFNIALKHGDVKAFFNKSYYHPADTLSVQIKDKQSNNHRLKYRVHLNYVQEKGTVQEKAKERVHKIERVYLYSDYQDVNPTSLSQGITFSLPEQIDGLDNIRTKNTKRELRFWEIVVEEKDERFFAGFVLDVR